MAQRWLKSAFYLFWAVLMTAATYVLGGAPLKALRSKAGRAAYWLLCVAIAAAIAAAQAKVLAIAFFSLVLLIGVFAELEDVGFGFMVSGFFTVLINALVSGGAFALWVSLTGPKWSQQILAFLENVLKPLTDLNPKLQINYMDLMLQLPSLVLILWMGAVYLAVLLEPRLMNGDPERERSLSLRAQLTEIRLPDAVVWLLIASLLGAFGGFGPRWVEAVSVNAMNICLLLFFFQGIAVVAKFFTAVRLGLFWQFLFMALIVVHLFLFVSLLGLVDYWLDFRARLSKRPEQFNREV